MKSSKSLVALMVFSFFAATLSFAGEANKDAPASKPAGCCANAAAKGEKCTHECCTEAAKAGNNCEKCHGSGKMEKEKKAETKK